MRKVLPVVIILLIAIIYMFNQKQEVEVAKDDTIRISIIDAHICIGLHKLRDNDRFTSWGPPHPSCPKTLNSFRRDLHGSHVLRTLLSTISKEDIGPVHIEHHNIYNDSGVQDLKKWENALSRIQTFRPHLIILAAGAPWSFRSKLELPEDLTFIVATPYKNPRKAVKKDDLFLWPTNLKHQSVIQIAEAIPNTYSQSKANLSEDSSSQASLSAAGPISQGYFDTGQDQNGSIDYYFWRDSDSIGFKGTSYATAKASSLILRFCLNELKLRNRPKLLGCMDSLSSPVNIDNVANVGKRLGKYYKLLHLPMKK